MTDEELENIQQLHTHRLISFVPEVSRASHRRAKDCETTVINAQGCYCFAVIVVISAQPSSVALLFAIHLYGKVTTPKTDGGFHS